MRRSTWILLLLAAGCGRGEGFSGTPQVGGWSMKEGAVASDTCKVSALPSGDGPFTLAFDGTKLTIDPKDGYPVFECAYERGAFDCPSRLRREVDLAKESGGFLEGTLTLNVAIQGNFTSATTLTGTEKGDVACTGSGCSAAASFYGTAFPCAVSKAITAKAD